MKDPLTRLTEKTTSLGNYNRKYLHIISTNIDQLTAALEQHGNRDRVHLWTYSMEIPGAMDTVLESASNHEEKIEFLGCYYALQFLHMNLHMMDIIRLELTSTPRRAQTGKKLMLETGRMFRHLTKCYMERLLNLFLDSKTMPEFVMLGVGTRADQDDIDLGITHIIRGDDHISNTPKQILLYQAFEAPVPRFAHQSLIFGPDKKKLSKRHGVTSVLQFREQGILPLALFNYLARMSWSLGKERIYELEEMIAQFSLDKKSRGNPCSTKNN